MCPTADHGAFKGRGGKPEVRLEAICDFDMYIWWLYFGTAGAANDLSIVSESPLFNAIRAGSWPPQRSQGIVEGLSLTWYYYLVDGIYPRFRIFAPPLPYSTTAKGKLYSKRQEAERKSVERLFGVLFKRFNILFQPSRLYRKADMRAVVQACAIIHNMVVAARRDGYADPIMRVDADAMRVVRPQQPASEAELREFWETHVDGTDDLQQQQALLEALQDHIWRVSGADS
ncbi:unnamed protein product [Chondrus crispus]|uniref:DDE Tnp4 domain-containing protein n=1 Tax=Chondrus crispus TaxID=2769 RepID=R7QG13_CHOCR|nr:unnamed protein product [Chondrus crispus]CDF36713.1 unnamed protein product [Chondrus crispus]|eukprot:XP_005716532.1 unnamed protein product [Chondrus crispus]